jgi:hypothetical protein
VTLAWRCYQQLRTAYATKSLREGKKVALQVLAAFHTCPIPEIARLGRTLRAWREQFLAYFITGRANNGGTEAINGIIELHRRIARGFRNPSNYRLRMILAAGRLTHPNPNKLNLSRAALLDGVESNVRLSQIATPTLLNTLGLRSTPVTLSIRKSL